MRSHFYSPLTFSRHIADYNTLNRLYVTKLAFALRPVRLDKFSLSTPSLVADSFFLDSKALNMSNFSHLNTLSNLDFIEDSYENLKSMNVFSPTSFKTFFHLKNTSLPAVSYATNLNMFRADFDESN